LLGAIATAIRIWLAYPSSCYEFAFIVGGATPDFDLGAGRKTTVENQSMPDALRIFSVEARAIKPAAT
jgi:hypothetical protein